MNIYSTVFDPNHIAKSSLFSPYTHKHICCIFYKITNVGIRIYVFAYKYNIKLKLNTEIEKRNTYIHLYM